MNEQSHWGILSHESPGAPQLHRLELDASKAASAESTPPKLEFIQEPVSQPEYCVSYAWGDLTEEGKEREAIVDRLCDAAEKRGIRILRDKNTVGLGEGISKFMGRIGQADRVFVVLSDKYLKSPYCMTELFEIWRNSRQNEGQFLGRIRVYTLPCTRIFSPLDRAQCAVYWKKQREALKTLMDENGSDILAKRISSNTS
jgi:internalin A